MYHVKHSTNKQEVFWFQHGPEKPPTAVWVNFRTKAQNLNESSLLFKMHNLDAVRSYTTVNYLSLIKKNALITTLTVMTVGFKLTTHTESEIFIFGAFCINHEINNFKIKKAKCMKNVE